MRIRLRALAGIFLRIGNTTFGGGDPTIAALERELVERRRVVTAEEYGVTYALCRVTPGTNMLAFCAGIGWLLRGWPGAALARLGMDRYTALVALAHVGNIDDEGLEAALKSDSFYIGALGSRRSHEKRLARLKARGIDDATLKRIHGPIGLDIGAVTPPEIAISIVAELVSKRRAKRRKPAAAV